MVRFIFLEAGDGIAQLSLFALISFFTSQRDTAKSQ